MVFWNRYLDWQPKTRNGIYSIELITLQHRAVRKCAVIWLDTMLLRVYWFRREIRGICSLKYYPRLLIRNLGASRCRRLSIQRWKARVKRLFRLNCCISQWLLKVVSTFIVYWRYLFTDFSISITYFFYSCEFSLHFLYCNILLHFEGHIRFRFRFL